MAFSRMIWTTTPPTPTADSTWDLWFTWNSGVEIIEVFNFDNINVGYNTIIIRKLSHKIAYYAIVKTTHNGDECYTVLFMSTASDAVGYGVADDDTWEYNEYGYKGTVTAIDGTTWYWAGFDWFGDISVYEPWNDILWGYDESLVLSDTVYSDGGEAARDLVSRIYFVPLQTDLNTDITSSMTAYLYGTHSGKTIRKAFGLMLAFSISKYEPFYSQYYGYIKHAYRALSDNANTIIYEMVDRIGNADYVNVGLGVWYPQTVCRMRLVCTYATLVNRTSPIIVEWFHNNPQDPRYGNNCIPYGNHRYTSTSIYNNDGKVFEISLWYGSSYSPDDIPEATYDFGSIRDAIAYDLSFGSLGFNNVTLNTCEDYLNEKGFSNMGLIL